MNFQELLQLQTLECLDNGKSFKNCQGDIEGAIEILNYFAGLADKLVGDTLPMGQWLVVGGWVSAVCLVGWISAVNFVKLLLIMFKVEVINKVLKRR